MISLLVLICVLHGNGTISGTAFGWCLGLWIFQALMRIVASIRSE